MQEQHGIVEVKPYGLIRLIGEKEPHRVNAETIDKLKNLPKNFKGNITIEELNLTTSMSQVAVMDIRFERVLVQKDFMKLPTETMFLDKDGNLLPKGGEYSEAKLQKAGVEYYTALCHYRVEKDGSHSYLAKFDQIPELLLMAPNLDDRSYPHAVAGIWHYGRKQEWE